MLMSEEKKGGEKRGQVERRKPRGSVSKVLPSFSLRHLARGKRNGFDAFQPRSLSKQASDPFDKTD